jgi:hypothetical protein
MFNTIVACLLPCVCPASLIPSGANSISYTVCVDSTFGNDSTARVQSTVSKFQTLPAAVAALAAAQAIASNQVWVCLLDPGVYGPVNLNDLSNIDFVGTTQDSTVIGPVTVTGGSGIHFETLTLLSIPVVVTNTAALTVNSNMDVALRNAGSVNGILATNSNLLLRHSEFRGTLTTATGIPAAMVSTAGDGSAPYNLTTLHNNMDFAITGPNITGAAYYGTAVESSNSIQVVALSNIQRLQTLNTNPTAPTTFGAKIGDIILLTKPKLQAPFISHSDIHMSETAQSSAASNFIGTVYHVGFDVVRTISLHGHNVTFEVPCSFTTLVELITSGASAASNTMAIANGMNATISCKQPFLTGTTSQASRTTAFSQLNVPYADYAVAPVKPGTSTVTQPVSQTNATGSIASSGSSSSGVLLMNGPDTKNVTSTATDGISNVTMAFENCVFTLPPSTTETSSRIIKINAVTVATKCLVLTASGDTFVNSSLSPTLFGISSNAGGMPNSATFTSNGAGQWIVSCIIIS